MGCLYHASTTKTVPPKNRSHSPFVCSFCLRLSGWWRSSVSFDRGLEWSTNRRLRNRYSAHVCVCVCVCMYLLYKLYLDSRLGDTQSRPVQVKTIGQARQSIYSGTVGSWHKHPCLIMFVLTACVQHWILQYCSSSWRNTCLDPKNFNGLTWRQSCSIKMLMFPKNQRKKGLHWLHERVVASSTERLAKRDPQNVVSMGIDSTNELCDRVSWLCRTWLARAWMNAEVFTTKIGLLLAEAVWWSRESQAFSVLSKCVLPQ